MRRRLPVIPRLRGLSDWTRGFDEIPPSRFVSKYCALEVNKKGQHFDLAG